ncbi:MAG: hypothetical protein MI863_10795 [Desulfobacterales bacterium]|nr:hypothetical protein [Desulfobacterales bacterium]
MDRFNIPDYTDFWWDTGNAAERQKIILENQTIPALLFAKETVPFYREHYKKLSVQNIQDISSLEEFVSVIPYITKVHLASNHPMAFVPQINLSEVDPHKGKYFRFGTGGTTGTPILIMHSMQDWRGMSRTADRLIEFDFYEDLFYRDNFEFQPGMFTFQGLESRTTPLSGKRILGAYNADHITNGIYATMLHRLGSDFYWRPSSAPTVEDIYDTARQFEVNGILAPPEGENNKKGAFLKDILAIDAGRQTQWNLSHRYNKAFQFVFWSSMPISEVLLDHLMTDRQIPYIKGHFGSTEVCPTAATCSKQMRNFHLSYGHSLVIIKKLDRDQMAAPDELGYALVSKTGATDMDGNNLPPSGMIFINYMTGDGARLSKDGTPCACGRNTPVLYDLQRIKFHDGKAKHGCQTA